MKKIITTITGNPFFRDSTIMIAGGVFLGAMNYVFTIVLAHIFSVSDFGQFQVYINLVSLLSVLGGALTPYAIRMSAQAVSASPDTEDFFNILGVYRRHRVGTVLCVMLCAFVVLLGFTHFVPIKGTIPFLIILTAITLTILASIFSGIVQGIKSFVYFTTVNVTATTLKILIAALVAVITHNPGMAVFGFLVAQFCSFFFFQKKTVAVFAHVNPHRSNAGGLLHTSLVKDILYTFLFSASLSFLTNADILLSQLVLKHEMLGMMSVFLIAGKMILYANITIMSVVMPYIASHKNEDNRSVIYLGYFILSSISAAGIGLFTLFPDFVLHILFHLPVHSLIEPLLWQTGIIAMLLSFLTLEATISYASKIKAFIALIVCISFAFGVTMYLFGSDIASLAQVLISVYGTGWLILLINRLAHPRQPVLSQGFTNAEKTIQSVV